MEEEADLQMDPEQDKEYKANEEKCKEIVKQAEQMEKLDKDITTIL